MNQFSERIRAIIVTDFLLRFRRTSTAVTFALMCIGVYFMIPDVSSGYAMMGIGEARAIYNSETIALGSSVFCTILLSLFGYYLVSNGIRRDVTARTGLIIAATPVTNTEYILGKFLGNVIFISAIGVGFMFASMGIFLLRGETMIEPLVFLKTFTMLNLPVVTFVSAIALIFETTSFLSGKIGDVLYFFLWTFLLSIVGIASAENAPEWIAYLDIVGMGMLMTQVVRESGTNNFQIGFMSIDANTPTIVFNGLRWDFHDIFTRFISAALPILLLPLAVIRFHRFNPTRIKLGALEQNRNWIAKLNQFSKPLSKWITPLYQIAASDRIHSRLFRSSLADTLLSLSLYPITILLMLAESVVMMVLPSEVMIASLPVITLLLIVVLADTVSRDHNSNTLRMIYTSPTLQSNYVFWKFMTALFLSIGFVIIPLLRLIALDASQAVSFLIGSVFTAAVATSLGILTQTPKAFAVLFLLFWYVVVSDSNHSSALDFAGWYRTATIQVQLSYVFVGFLFLVVAELKHKRTLKLKY